VQYFEPLVVSRPVAKGLQDPTQHLFFYAWHNGQTLFPKNTFSLLPYQLRPIQDISEDKFCSTWRNDARGRKMLVNII